MRKQKCLISSAAVLFLLLFLFAPSAAEAKVSGDPAGTQWAFEHIKLPAAWDKTTGSRQVVAAVIDNGFDTFHPDLFDNVWINEKEIPRNGQDDDKNGYVDDIYGWNFVDGNNDPRPNVEKMTDWEKKEGIVSHGTLVAGIIGAVGDNGLGMAGVNWQVRLMNLKVIGASGEGDFKFVPSAIRYAANNGADVINISLVGADSPETLSEVKAAVKYAYEKGVAIFAAAGNSMESLADYAHYPICADAGEKEQWILGVSAITENHRLALFSNSGGGCVDITAPGVNITSTVRFSPTNGLPDLVSGGWNGTSFSAPLVTGAAALVKAVNPGWQAKEIYEALQFTVHHTSGQDEVVYAKLFGAGLLQADKAVDYAWQRKRDDSYLSLLEPNTTATNLAMGDIDGDGKEELVVGRGPYIEIYQPGGMVLKRKFLAFDIPGQVDLILTLLDYDKDGKQDIAVYAKGSEQPIKIWNYKVKILNY